MKIFVVILVLIGSQSCARILIPDDISINISSLKECQESGEYPVEVSNVIINLNRGKISVTGTLTTSVDLTSPIKAVIKVEKDELGAWIEVPCLKNIGSCSYDDLCVHSIPQNETCPQNFITNNVPCRCPIAKGTYTIPTNLAFELNPHNYSSVYSGKYWARILLSHNDLNLTCYEVYFEIEDRNTYIDTNYIDRPFVTLV